MNSIKSSLILNKLIFDKIEFKRLGFKNSNKIEYELETRLANNKDNNDVYRVTLVLSGEKKQEYIFTISLTGYFTFDEKEQLTERIKTTLITKNTVAILMPYLRSQVSLLTAQPEVDCIVLPPFNINRLIEEKEIQKQKKSE